MKISTPPPPALHPVDPVLVVDDEEQALLGVQVLLRSNGIGNVRAISNSLEAPKLLEQQTFSALLLDLWMPNLSGEDILEVARTIDPALPVIILTCENDVDVAVRCMRNGAFDYILRPVDRNRLVMSLQRALQFRELQRQNRMLKQHILTGEIENESAFRGMLSINPKMKAIFAYLESVAPSTQPVLVLGETGVGKDLMARAIHATSGRKGQYVAVNVAGLDDTVFSDTLFGHKRGAFTGADADRKGLVEVAAGGTLFLDEIGDLPMATQVKLLRLLQEREYYPMGSDVPKRADARFVVATNQDLATLVREGRFRKDLYYRLQTHEIHIPPLRERREDLPLLVQHFLERSAEALGKPVPTVPPELYTLLNLYTFPGNIRELESMVHDAMSKERGRTLSLDAFRARVMGAAKRGINEPTPMFFSLPTGGRVTFHDTLPTLKEVADLLVDEALARARGNQTIAAQLLGVTQQALSKRLKARSENQSGSDATPLA